ncbi:hypothetical protein NODU109028_09315 [Nocardioides dubius]|uniref:WXG100 family type VII secretion target n=1 Tax=Nocardioides dubius TaxID=317019 RepID=A0ABN1TUV5_9ACTN
MNIATLKSWKPGSLDAVIDTLNTRRKGLADLTDEMVDGTPPAAWVSDDAEAARAAHVRMCDRLADATATVAAVLGGVSEAQSDLIRAKRLMDDQLATAVSYGWTVDTTSNTITVPAPPIWAQEPGSGIGIAMAQGMADECAREIGYALEDAQAADDALARILRAAARGEYDVNIGADGGKFAGVMDQLDDPITDGQLPGWGELDPVRRQAQIDAFTEAMGRPPSSVADWKLAAALDPTSYDAKYQDTDAVIQIGRITPQPGQGTVRIGLFIPIDQVTNFPHGDLGDNRGFDPHFDPEQTRVTMFIDYETGTIVVRQNPSVDAAGNVEVDTPRVDVRQTTAGNLEVHYDAINPFAPPGSDLMHTVNGTLYVNPGPGGPQVGGTIGDYPQFEAYHDAPDGTTNTVVQDEADNMSSLGPMLELPQHHDVGDPQYGDAPFSSWRHLSGEYWERHGTAPSTRLGEDTDVPAVEPYLGGSGPGDRGDVEVA